MSAGVECNEPKSRRVFRLLSECCRSQSGKWFPLLPPEVLLSPRSATHFANRKRLLFIINETPVFIQQFFYFLTYTIVKNVYGGSEKKL